MKCKSLTMLFILILLLASSPLASQAAPGTITTKHTTIQGKDRTYLVYQPTGCENKSCPALFMFHGLNGTAQQAADNYGWKNMADQNSFIAVFPESLTIPKKDVMFGNIVVYSEYDVAGKHWDIANISLPLEQRYSTQDVEFVSKMIDELALNYQILTSRIYSVGHSYGAFFSYYLSVCLPDKITAFAAHSGGLVKFIDPFVFAIPARDAKANPAFDVPGILLNSPGDNIVNFTWAQNLHQELETKGYTHDFITLDQSLGHNWDLTKNQTIWTFLTNNSPALPTPPVTVNFGSTADTGKENIAGATIAVKLDGASTESVTVKIAPAVESTATFNSDYQLSATTLTFAPGETEKTFSLTTLPDALIEPVETAILNLTVTQGNAVLGANTKYTYTITDDTPIPPLPKDTVQFETVASSVNEYIDKTTKVVSHTVTIKRDGASGKSFTVSVGAAAGGTATFAKDYGLPVTTVTFGQQEFNKTFTMSIICDSLAEPNETVILKLHNLKGDVSLGANVNHTVTIVDNTPLKKVLTLPKLYYLLKDYKRDWPKFPPRK